MATLSPGKPVEAFRVYDESNARHDGVLAHYTQMRTFQSLAFSRAQVAKWTASWGARPGGRMTVRDALLKCDSFVDRSDPDTSLPNSLHMLQSAEGARAAGKPDWFVLCALVHDVGKLMYLWGTCEEGQGGKGTDPQWALGGDTWIVGAPLPDAAMVHPQLNRLNPDYAAYDDLPTGIYRAGQGIMECEFAFGHDEYAYMWALHNKVAIPREGLAILRLHSCYVSLRAR
jgi:inositol oxygenase